MVTKRKSSAITRSASTAPCDQSPLQILSQVFSKFQPMVAQLKFREDGGGTLEIYDELDILYFLTALLKIYFKDIRPQEWVQNYVGESNRRYLLLKNEQIILRVNRARNNWGTSEIEKQVTADAERCRNIPDGKTLVCFVYDPDGWIRTARTLETELDALSNQHVAVHVIVEPKIHG